MNIRGLHPFTLVDFPGKLACVVFVGNCNFRCGYCHNPALVFDPESQPHIPEEEFFDFLDHRVGKLDGVVISGGEPSLRSALDNFIGEIKSRRFAVKLDTNGSNANRVMKICEDHGIDAFGIDYKAPVAKYPHVTNCDDADIAEKVHTLIRFAVENKIPADVRTTVHRFLLSPEDLHEMRRELDELGQEDWVLQQFHPAEIIDESLLEEDTYSDQELLNLATELGGETRVRGLKGILLR
jgi:pyruvate formate lyase activating enzyme